MRISLALVVAVLLARPLAAQTVEVGPATRVRSVEFVVDGGPRFTQEELQEQVAARGRGSLVGLRRALGWIPLVSGVEEHLFDPRETQRDRERLRRYLVRLGYPEAAVEYEVAHDPEADEVAIEFHIRAGRPLLVRSLSVAWTDSAPPLDPSPVLREVRRHVLPQRQPLDSLAARAAARTLRRWLSDRGYAFARVRPQVTVDTAGSAADVVLLASAGPRARIGAIEIEGDPRLSPRFIRQFAGVHTGDWFSRSRLRNAGQRLTTLDLVEAASFRVPRDAPVDTVVPLRLWVQKAVPREVSGQAGYSTEGGLGGEAQWVNRAIFRGGQSLTLSLAGESSVLALAGNANRFVRGSATLRQPLRSSTQLSLLFGPFAEYRDDFRKRSFALGLETTLLYRLGTQSSIALRHTLATERYYQYHFGTATGGIDLIDLLRLSAQGLLDSLGTRINTSELSLSASLGSLDVPTDPRRGFMVQPVVSAGVPGALSTNEYLTAAVRTSAYLPLSKRFGLAARLGGGKLWPLGKSVPDSAAEGLLAAFRLRDQLLTAGGTSDVRGWGEDLLGPKFPQVIITTSPDSIGQLRADRYTPIGGFNKLFGTIELRGPVPLMGPAWGSYVFADGGRIWTTDARFGNTDDPLGDERFFWALGIGVDYATPVGAVAVAVGYKMNPSLLDLADPNDVINALLNGTPVEQVPRHQGRRFQLHIGLGRRL